MLILASGSTTRKALLAGAGLNFESCPAPIDERAIEQSLVGKPPEIVARTLAEAKAQIVSAERGDAWVIGADQVLDVGGRLLHKPAGMAEAREQLLVLRGRIHHLHSAIAIARGGQLQWSAVETATLAMRDFSGPTLDAVLGKEGEAVLDSVGGYRLEGPSIHLFERIEGDYFTILGLPLLPLLAALRNLAPEERFT